MKKSKIAIIILLIAILISQAYIIYLLSFPREDVNKDGKINALDLLIVQKKILEEGEK